MVERSAQKFIKKIAKADEQQAEAILTAILREKRFLATIFDALADGVLVIRANLDLVFANATAWKLLGIFPPQKYVGRRFTDLPLPDDITKPVARFVLEQTEETSFQLELAGEAPRWLQVSLRHFEFDGAGDTQKLVMILLRDVTAWYQAEEQRRRAEYWKQMATFAAGLAHEIKNPLNSLQIHAQLLQRALQQKTKRSRSAQWSRPLQSCDIIVEEIARLARVVNEFLAAVRPSRPLFQRANINYHIERVVATFRPEAEARGVQLHLTLDYEIPPVDFDPNQITQVLLNLLKNALEALDGCENPTIEVATELEEDHYIIRIRDNGRGIAADDLSRIHEPFFTTKAKGTGLGLAIVSRIVEEHAGRVEIHSDLNRGTTVLLRFPLVQRPVRLLETTEAASSPLVVTKAPEDGTQSGPVLQSHRDGAD
jgi:signal transduction histidine kinase